MAALEEQLFASGLPVEALMEKAALAVSRLLLEQHGERLARDGALVLVGPGHNGGDGLVVARELHLAGVATTIWSPFDNHKPVPLESLCQLLARYVLARTMHHPVADGQNLGLNR
mgnify:CR=1 FL=1